MTIYRFSIEVGGIDPEEENLENRFYGNGVDDASICISNGQVIIAFDREAVNEEAAILSASRDIVERGGRVTRVTWDNPRTW
jgi:hypothetical protein